MEHKAFWDFGLGMLLYRGLFVLFGFSLGWLLWRNNQSERESRSLIAAIQKLQSDIGPVTVIIHAQTQVLLTRSGTPLPQEIEVIVRSIHEQSLKLQSIAKDSTALLTYRKPRLANADSRSVSRCRVLGPLMRRTYGAQRSLAFYLMFRIEESRSARSQWFTIGTAPCAVMKTQSA